MWDGVKIECELCGERFNTFEVRGHKCQEKKMDESIWCGVCNRLVHKERLLSHGCTDAYEVQVSTELGTKTDSGKHRWSLLPSGTVQQVIKVLEFGAKKYQVGNWIKVTDANTRYYDATMRHIEAWRDGEMNDPESGLPHLAHAAACLLFLMWFDGKSVS